MASSTTSTSAPHAFAAAELDVGSAIIVTGSKRAIVAATSAWAARPRRCARRTARLAPASTSRCARAARSRPACAPSSLVPQWAARRPSRVSSGPYRSGRRSRNRPHAVALGAQLVELERGADHTLAVAAGLGDLGARGVGDERRAVERDLGRRSPTSWPTRLAATSGMRLAPAWPCITRCQWPLESHVGIGRLAADRGRVAAAPRRRAAPCTAPTRGTTGPSRSRRRSSPWRVAHTRKPVSPPLK